MSLENIPIRFQNRAKELGLFHKHEREKVLTELYYEFIELKKKKSEYSYFSIIFLFFWVCLGTYIGFQILMWLGDELTQISLTSIKLFFEESTWLEILQIIVGIPFVLFFLFLMFVGGPLDSIQKFLSARDIKKKKLRQIILNIIRVYEFDNKLLEDSYDDIPKKLRDDFQDLLIKDKQICDFYTTELKKINDLVKEQKKLLEEDIYSKLDFDWKTELEDLSKCSPNEFTFMIENEKFPAKKELSSSEIKAYKKIFLIFKSLVEFQIKNYDSIYNFVEKKNNKLPSLISPITKTSQIKEKELENYLLYTCKTRELHPLLENQEIMVRESMDRILQLKRNNLTRDINSASNIEHYDFKFIEPFYAQGQLKKKLEFAKKKMKEFQN